MGGIGSPMPFIKDEPEDYQFDQSRYMASMNGQNSYHQHGQQYNTWQGTMNNDNSDMNIGGGHNMRSGFGSQQNLSSNFIGDDELADLLAEADANADHNMNSLNGFGPHGQFNGHYGGDTQNSSAMPVQRGQFMGNSSVFSQTPEGAPIQSPFIHPFNYAQWATAGPQQQNANQQRRPSNNLQSGSYDLSSRVRSNLNHERASSISRSPMTPKTPGQIAMPVGTPDSTAYSGQPIRGHRKTSSSQWDSNTFSSGPSYVDSPLSSPHSGPMQPQISDVMNGSRPGSVTAKVEPGAQSAPPTTLEAKRQKRRQSHNAVERRRRDNINERIQELSHLVPQHRLEDDKLSKHIRNNSMFSPSLGPTNMSPPQATSLLAGGTGRRAAGSITQGLPVEDKDKGPAKGDVLNGAVAWTRDLMWLLNRYVERETKFTELLARHGEQVPQYLQLTDDDHRMQRELLDAIQLNGPANFKYSRTNGSGLFVPRFTDHAGNPVGSTPGQQYPPNMSSNSDPQLWEYNNMINDDPSSIDFKEEEEFGMELE